MKKLILLILFLPTFLFATESKLLCSGEEIKSIKGDSNSQRAYKKVIGIQVFQEGMRLDGEWFDNNNDLTDDYTLERSFLNTNQKITAQRKFSTNAFIENNKIQTIKIDKVDIDSSNNNILWEHEFNRINSTDNKNEVIYAFKKTFEGVCREK